MSEIIRLGEEEFRCSEKVFDLYWRFLGLRDSNLQLSCQEKLSHPEDSRRHKSVSEAYSTAMDMLLMSFHIKQGAPKLGRPKK